MNWLQVEIELGELEPDPVEQALLELGALSIELSDSGNDPILEPEPGTTPLWKSIKIAALLDIELSQKVVRRAIEKSVAPALLPSIRFTTLAEQDWIAKWKQDLRPERFGNNFWVCPIGQPCPDPAGIAIHLEPGLAFGTGSHPTTALCLAWLTKQNLVDKSLLDYGCGSGILAVAGVALGAANATGVDIDEQALIAARDNARNNECIDQIQVLATGQLDSSNSFDFIVANILSDALVGLAPALKHHSHPGTRIALSGILSDQAGTVRDAYQNWFEFDEPQQSKEWVMLTGTVIYGK